jgi:iron complex transport system substrate-binding protein
VKKPAHQWETRLHRAVRRAEPPGGEWADDARAEAFDLQFADRTGRADLGLALQRVDGESARDPDLVHAVQCWLVARGARSIALEDDRGTVLAQGPIDVDALGTPARAPVARLITLAPSNAEIVDALGCFDRVVACEDSSDEPAEVARCERLGPDLAPDLDRVAALAPDLVVSSLTVPGMERIVTGLRARGVAQIVSAPRRFADVLADLERIGAALGVESRAVGVVAELRAEVERLVATRPAIPARVYLEWWPRPMFTPGCDCYSNEIIALAGGTNVFGDRTGSSLEIDAADLRAADPDVCFVSWCGVAEDKLDPENLVRREGLAELRAVRAGRVYKLDERYSGRPGPRLLEAARRMRAAIVSATR